MGKKTVSTRLPEELVDGIDAITENRSNFVARAVLGMMDDPDLIESAIERKKQERTSLMEEKHELELQIEKKRDQIRELEDLKTQAKTLRQVREEIPESELQSIRDIVRQNKYDNDPRSASPEQVIEHNAERLATKFDLDKGEIEQVLRITTDL